ncbi:MAG: dienelactone hydrolase family protein [Pseudomonadota bacterium]
MAINTNLVDYTVDGTTFEGFVAFDEAVSGPHPGVLIFHTIAGRTEFEERKALELAELGYTAMAADVYGKGTLTTDFESNRQMMDALRDDRPALQARLMAALHTLRGHAAVDTARTAAIGYCFGGMCVLDIARLGEDIAGVVSFHGIFAPPGNTIDNTIAAKVLVLHGWDDPLAKPDEVLALSEELTRQGADWQIHAYGNTLHAFTNPAANVPDDVKRYSASADRRSWAAARIFLDELFS